MSRFSDRTKRLTRRQESDAFRFYIMPVSWIFGLVGLLGLGSLWISADLDLRKVTDSAAFAVFAALLGVPLLVLLLRFVRGHFHAAVREL
jgi:hypothetical protein